MEDSQFIDPESDFLEDKNTYEEIVINQIKKTADSLSKDLTMVIVTNQKSGTAYREDNRKTAINHIKTLRGLIFPFLEKKKEKGYVEKIEKELQDFTEKYGSQELIVPGKGKVKYSSMIHDLDSVPYSNLMETKMDVHREIFDLLVGAYKKYKDEIAAFSIE